MAVNTRPKSVAVIVHNDVMRDARVLKEASSLANAGFAVTVFGISAQASSLNYQGATIHLLPFCGSLLKRLREALFRNKKAVMAATVAGGAACLVTIGLLQPGLVLPLMAVAIVTVGLCYAFRGVLSRLFLMLYRTSTWDAMARLLESAAQRDRYDVVHAHDVIGLMAGSRLKEKQHQVRLIWDAHEIYEQQGTASRLQALWFRALLKRYSRNVDAFITINESIKTFYQQNYGLPPALVVMNATVFAGRIVDDGRLRRASGLDESRKILLFHGGFSDHRGILQLMEAARGLPQPWSIVMMGWGKAEVKLKELARELENVHGRENAPLVVLPPVSQAELPAWIAGADLGAIPYEDVGLNHLYCTPNKLWEYPNSGVPILATSLVEMERIIKDWGTGFLLPRKFSGSDIVQALETISENDLREAHARCSEFSERLSWQVFESNLLKAYDCA